MRKKNRECNDPAFFDEVFAAADEIFLAMHDGDYPYVLPLNFARLGQVIYIHCALEGHKLAESPCGLYHHCGRNHTPRKIHHVLQIALRQGACPHC